MKGGQGLLGRSCFESVMRTFETIEMARRLCILRTQYARVRDLKTESVIWVAQIAFLGPLQGDIFCLFHLFTGLCLLTLLQCSETVEGYYCEMSSSERKLDAKSRGETLPV